VWTGKACIDAESPDMFAIAFFQSVRMPVDERLAVFLACLHGAQDTLLVLGFA
jgi:hypothetical protein